MDQSSLKKGSQISSMKEDFLRGLGFSRRWSQVSLFQIFHFPEILRAGIASRQNEKKLEAATHELGEFVYQRKAQESLDEGEVIEWDLLRGRVLLFMEERNRLLRRGGKSDFPFTGSVGESKDSNLSQSSGGEKE